MLMPMPCQAVLFDLDGTLLDTLEDLADATNAALAELGLPGHPLEAYKQFVGDGLENLVRRAMRQRALDEALLARGIELDAARICRPLGGKDPALPGHPGPVGWAQPPRRFPWPCSRTSRTSSRGCA